jgi:hypothetical protein
MPRRHGIVAPTPRHAVVAKYHDRPMFKHHGLGVLRHRSDVSRSGFHAVGFGLIGPQKAGDWMAQNTGYEQASRTARGLGDALDGPIPIATPRASQGRSRHIRGATGGYGSTLPGPTAANRQGLTMATTAVPRRQCQAIGREIPEDEDLEGRDMPVCQRVETGVAEFEAFTVPTSFDWDRPPATVAQRENGGHWPVSPGIYARPPMVIIASRDAPARLRSDPKCPVSREALFAARCSPIKA